MDDNEVFVEKKVNLDFPSNSHIRRSEARQEVKKETEPEVKKVSKIITGKVITRKKSLGKRFIEAFIGDDAGGSVGGYILYDVLVPAIKNTLSDMVKGGTEMLLFPGENRSGSRTSRDRGKSYVSYNSYGGRDRDRDRDRDRGRDRSSQNRARHNFDDIVIGSRGEAEEVLSNLVDLTVDYNQATVADLYELVGITGNFTDNKYGWTDLRSASVSRVRDGYLLNLPKCILLD